jgi:sigma-B regulation protein RsbQ
MEGNKVIEQWGSKGPVLVFLHYFGGAAQSWQWVAEMLKSDFRCVALTLPGFGGVPGFAQPTLQRFASYVLEQLASLGIKECSLVCHSMGAKIALLFAANASKGFVQQLILVAPSPPSTEPLSATEKARLLQRPDLKEAKKVIAQIIKAPLGEAQYALAIANQLALDDTTRKWWLFEGMVNPITDIVASLRLPLTVLASEDDPIITIHLVQKEVMPVFPQAKLVTTKGIGHLSPMEDPGWIAEQIRIAV